MCIYILMNGLMTIHFYIFMGKWPMFWVTRGFGAQDNLHMFIFWTWFYYIDVVQDQDAFKCYTGIYRWHRDVGPGPLGCFIHGSSSMNWHACCYAACCLRGFRGGVTTFLIVGSGWFIVHALTYMLHTCWYAVHSSCYTSWYFCCYAPRGSILKVCFGPRPHDHGISWPLSNDRCSQNTEGCKNHCTKRCWKCWFRQGPRDPVSCFEHGTWIWLVPLVPKMAKSGCPLGSWDLMDLVVSTHDTLWHGCIVNRGSTNGYISQEWCQNWVAGPSSLFQVGVSKGHSGNSKDSKIANWFAHADNCFGFDPPSKTQLESSWGKRGVNAEISGMRTVWWSHEFLELPYPPGCQSLMRQLHEVCRDVPVFGLEFSCALLGGDTRKPSFLAWNVPV